MIRSMRRRVYIILAGSLIVTGGGIIMRAAQSEPFNPPQFYSKSCLGCHGSQAQKNFNTDLPEGQMVDAIVNGLPMPEPPDMPAFAEKGVNEERARALIAHMKSLHQEP